MKNPGSSTNAKGKVTKKRKILTKSKEKAAARQKKEKMKKEKENIKNMLKKQKSNINGKVCCSEQLQITALIDLRLSFSDFQCKYRCMYLKFGLTQRNANVS